MCARVFPDHGHIHIAAVPAAQCGRQSVAQPARLVRSPPHLGEQVLPLLCRDAVVVHVGARELPAMVEVLHVLGLQRGDLTLDEGVHLGEQ